MRVRVFRNLTRRCLSIQARDERGVWLTVAHAEHVELDGVGFRVSEAGRQRVISTGKKTVHAWADGFLAAWSGKLTDAADKLSPGLREKLGVCMVPTVFADPNEAIGTWHPVTYNPHRTATFIRRDTGEPVREVLYAHLSTRGVWVCGLVVNA